MQTYTHYAITDFLSRKIRARQEEIDWRGLTEGPTADRQFPLPPLNNATALVGSVAPDAPLTLTFLVFLAMDYLAGKSFNLRMESSNAEEARTQSRVGHLFGTLFFKDWRMKGVHNLFHAPLLTLLYTGIGYLGWKRGKRWGAGLFWFGASCTLHTAIDIPLHYDDGPLLLFPLDWETRYYSPVSYWDPKRYGRQFAIFEHLLLSGLVGWLVRDWWVGKHLSEKQNS